MTPPEKTILWILDYFPRPHDPTTGVWALETIKAIQRQGKHVVVLSITPWIPKWLAITPTLRAWANVPDQWKIHQIPIFYPKCPHYPHRFVTQWCYNHLPFFDSSFLWPWCEKTIAHIMTSFSIEAIHANFIFPNGYIGFKIKKQYGIPLVVHERSLTRLAMAREHPRRRKIYTQVINEADKLITMNRRMVTLLKQMTSITKDIVILPAAADIGSISGLKQRKPPLYENKQIILSVGTLIERKGHAYLIKAIHLVREEFPHLKCLIMGEGQQRSRLQALIEQFNLLEFVELLGKRPHEEVLRTMSWCDIFVLPSWDEPFGTVIAEALAFSKPVVASEGEGASEMLENGRHSLLVKKQDSRSLAGALQKLLRDPELAKRIGGAAGELAERELNYHSLAQRLIKIYGQIER